MTFRVFSNGAIMGTFDICDTDYNTDIWEPGLMKIFVTWQLIVTLDSICNSCNVSLKIFLPYIWCGSSLWGCVPWTGQPCLELSEPQASFLSFSLFLHKFTSWQTNQYAVVLTQFGFAAGSMMVDLRPHWRSLLHGFGRSSTRWRPLPPACSRHTPESHRYSYQLSFYKKMN